MPNRENFPTFRDPKDEEMRDPHEFTTKLNRALDLHGVPERHRGRVLLSCITDRVMAEDVERTIVNVSTDYKQMVEKFKEKFHDPTMRNKWLVELRQCKMAFRERAYEYSERFQALVVRVSGNFPIDNPITIEMCESGYIPAIREKLASYRARMTESTGHPYMFPNLAKLYEEASKAETMARPGNTGSGNVGRGKRKHNGKYGEAAVHHAASAAATPTSSTATVNKIEINESGKPVNVNKKHKSKQSRPFTQSPNVPPRGGMSFRGGRGGFNNRGGGSSNRGENNNSRGGYNNGHRGGMSSSLDSIKPSLETNRAFYGRCFGCNRQGHRIDSCPYKGGGTKSGGSQRP